MNPDARRAIEWECTRLVNLYATYNDQARWSDAAALYAEGGLMTRPTAPDAPIVGRAAILESFLARPARYSRHICANIVVDVEDDDHARATSMILLFTAAAPAGTGELPVTVAPLVGEYRDRFVRTGEGWRFAERRGALSFRPAG